MIMDSTGPEIPDFMTRQAPPYKLVLRISSHYVYTEYFTSGDYLQVATYILSSPYKERIDYL